MCANKLSDYADLLRVHQKTTDEGVAAAASSRGTKRKHRTSELSSAEEENEKRVQQQRGKVCKSRSQTADGTTVKPVSLTSIAQFKGLSDTVIPQIKSMSELLLDNVHMSSDANGEPIC